MPAAAALAFILWFYQRQWAYLVIAVVVLLLIIEAISIVQRKVRLRALSIDEIDQMSGPQFEEYVAQLLRRQGYQVKEIGGRSDLGIDLIATRKGIRTAIQVKRWKRWIGRQAISDAVAGVKAYDCHKAAVVTNSYFSREAQAVAEANGCKLIDRDALAAEIHKTNKRGKA